ncbi:MAG: hypothetical protein ABIJ12_05890 [bacterium]
MTSNQDEILLNWQICGDKPAFGTLSGLGFEPGYHTWVPHSLGHVEKPFGFVIPAKAGIYLSLML